MSVLSVEKIVHLQQNPSNIRNVCIMAHVDHGKTTLADRLIASNGIISQRLAGKLRYMDSREDEQARGITMKSSAITLYYGMNGEEYLINLIDSPGHVDFSLEVSTAVRLCDGAIILVDVVEGVCAQTQVALKQAWREKLKPILVLNKIDRLILEIKMHPLDAYVHLTQILEQVNAVVGDLFKSDVLDFAECAPENATLENSFSHWETGLEDIDDSHVYFSPEQGNVVFASAIDGWGFCISDFAEILASKYGFSKNTLNKTLWGDYYFRSKTKQVLKGAREKAKKPLFVQFILENIWEFYDIILNQKSKDRCQQIASKLNVHLKPRDLRTSDHRILLQTIFSQWLPLGNAVLRAVCLKCLAPNQLPKEKVDILMFNKTEEVCCQLPEMLAIKQSFLECSHEENAPIIVFISKMVLVEKRHMPENRPVPLSEEEIKIRREKVKEKLLEANLGGKECCEQKNQLSSERDIQNCCNINDNLENEGKSFEMVAFARIYSGCLRKGKQVYVIGPKHDPLAALQKLKSGYEIDPNKTLKDLKSDEHITQARVGNLYILMGRELELLDSVPAGNVLGIGGLEEHVLKCATLSTEIGCPAFSELQKTVTPILRVAIEPENPSELPKLVHGLKLLNQADACVQVLVQETGEHVLVTAGEVHLQRCVKDLEDSYAKVSVRISEPIIPFRETIVNPVCVEENDESAGKKIPENTERIIVTNTANNNCCIKLKAVPLPQDVTTFLENSSEVIKLLYDHTCFKNDLETKTEDSQENFLEQEGMTEHARKIITAFKTKLSDMFQTGGEFWKNVPVDKIWSFGPRNCGPNILLNLVSANGNRSIWKRPKKDPSNIYLKYDNSFLNGFQLATLAGPLCEEPMMGVCFVALDWTFNETSAAPYGPISGQVMYAVKDGCRRAFQAQPQRLMAAMYSCNIQVNTEVLGKMYAVLGKRHGRILHGDMASGSSASFNVTATLPVAESFSFAPEIRKQTSGLANPQLVFSHWEVIDMDPFWKPSTEEEYLHYGEKGDTENYAHTYMNAVRKRKGLPVDEQIVEHGEKQRTLSKNK